MKEHQIQTLWVDKYRPEKLDDLVLSPETKKYFKDMVKSGNVLNATFSGPAGIGKSTICRVICNELNAETLFIPCAVKGTVATAQGQLKEFCDAMSFDGRPKIVILDEVDASSATQDSSFQKALRNLIEAAQSDTRFLLNCNYIEKVLQPIKSRCPVVNLSFSKRDLLSRIKKILDAEKVSYTKDSIAQFIISAFRWYPDVRRIISFLQGCCTTGKLVVLEKDIQGTEKQQIAEQLADEAAGSSSLLELRKKYIKSKELISDFIEAGSMLFNYAVDKGIVQSEEGVLKLTDLLWQLNAVVDKEPTFFGMLAAIRKFKG